jgi:Protein of unknown function (DUF1275)
MGCHGIPRSWPSGAGLGRGPRRPGIAHPRCLLPAVAALTGTSVLPFAGDGRYATIAVLAMALGVQNSTVRHLGAPDLTTTVLTLTLTGLTADSALAGGPGARPYRRLGSVAAMLAGAGAGAGILQWWSPAVVIAVAATLVAAVAVAFMTAVPAAARQGGRQAATGTAHGEPARLRDVARPGRLRAAVPDSGRAKTR